MYRGADKSLARPGMRQAQKPHRDARDFNKIETRVLIKFLFLQGKAPKEIRFILTETFAYFLPGRAKDFAQTPVHILPETVGSSSPTMRWAKLNGVATGYCRVQICCLHLHHKYRTSQCKKRRKVTITSPS